MLVIRLTRIGKKNQPTFRVVLAQKSAPIKGKFIEILGSYDPRLKTKAFKGDRIKYWLSKGAQASPTVHNLLVSEKIIEGPKVKAWRPKIKSAEAKAVAAAAAKPASEQPAVETPAAVVPAEPVEEAKDEEKTA